jgi:hypothetical protein
VPICGTLVQVAFLKERQHLFRPTPEQLHCFSIVRGPVRNPWPHWGYSVLWTIFAILLILWLLGWGFHVAGSLIHLLLVLAIIVAIISLVTGRRTV